MRRIRFSLRVSAGERRGERERERERKNNYKKHIRARWAKLVAGSSIDIPVIDTDMLALRRTTSGCPLENAEGEDMADGLHEKRHILGQRWLAPNEDEPAELRTKMGRHRC